MKLNHDNISSTAPAAETGTAIGGWQLFKASACAGAGWAAGKAAIDTVVGVCAAAAGAAGVAGAAAMAGLFGGKGEEKKEEPKK